MKFGITAAAVAGALLLASPPGIASVITFDEFAPGNNNIALAGEYLPLGVTFHGDNSGIWSGLSQGDPGNWLLQGSNGAAFLGNNGIGNNFSYLTTITFASAMAGASFDVARSNGSTAGQTLVASAYDGATLLATQSFVLGAINSWTSVAFGMSGIRSLVITGSANGFSPYGIDNLRFNEAGDSLLSGLTAGQQEVTAIPEPATGALMLAGMGLLGFAGRRRKNGSAAC